VVDINQNKVQQSLKLF